MLQLQATHCSGFIESYPSRNSNFVCAVLCMQKRRVAYYDSLDRFDNVERDEKIHDLMHKRLFDGAPLPADWEVTSDLETSPQQLNGCDCGVLTCTCAVFLAHGRSLAYDQSLMETATKRIALSIARQVAVI